MNVLVTGSNGFIGRHLVRHLLGMGHYVIGLDLHHSRNEECPTYYDDITRPFVLEHQIDDIYHLAAMSRVGHCESNPSTATRVNIIGTQHVLMIAAIRKVPVCVFSSAAVYDSRWVFSPCSVYGHSKLAAEQVCDMYRGHVPHVTVVRPYNVFGPGGGSLLEVILAKKNGGEVLKVHGDGQQTRDFIHVEDVVREVVEVHEQRRHESADIGSGREHKILDLVEASGVSFTFEGKNVGPMRSRSKSFRRVTISPLDYIRQ